MKKIIATTIITATMTLTAAQPVVDKVPRLDVMAGNYYDYMVVETADGNVWMVDEVFNDDEILKIRSIDSRY